MPAVYVCQDSPAPALPADCVTWAAQDYMPNPFYLDVEPAVEVSVAILTLWALAWVFRQCARLINNL